MRLIDADALSESIKRGAGTDLQKFFADVCVATAPTVDAAPIVHGRWENGNPICPVCGEDKFKDLDADIWCDWQPDFCPHCGAKMGGGADHEAG